MEYFGGKTAARACPVCGGNHVESIEKIRMILPDSIPLPNEYDIVSCDHCGFSYANTSASKEAYDSYYAAYNNYSFTYSKQMETSSYDYTFLQVVQLVGEYIQRTDNILDIGFGSGTLLLNLHREGYQNLTGVDPSQNSVDHLKQAGIAAFRKSVYEDAGDLKGRFHAVFLMSVAEHLLFPKEAITQASSYLKEGGYLLVDIPDYSKVDHINRPIPNQFNQEHINYFSEQSFANLLLGTGCWVEKCESIEKNGEPCLLFVIQKQPRNLKDMAPGIQRDEKTKKAIKRYLAQQLSVQEKTEQVLLELLENQTPIVIWGTGAMTMQLLAGTNLAKCDIRAFVDKNPAKIGKVFYGKKVLPPENVALYPEATVLICAMLYSQEIKDEMEAMGLSNEVISLT